MAHLIYADNSSRARSVKRVREDRFEFLPYGLVPSSPVEHLPGNAIAIIKERKEDVLSPDVR